MLRCDRNDVVRAQQREGQGEFPSPLSTSAPDMHTELSDLVEGLFDRPGLKCVERVNVLYFIEEISSPSRVGHCRNTTLARHNLKALQKLWWSKKHFKKSRCTKADECDTRRGRRRTDK